MKKTKIITTLGPACEKPEIIEAMANAGMNICRLNFSFGTFEEHQQKIDSVRAIGKKLGRSIAIMQCLQGPKIRIGKLNKAIDVKEGQEIILSGNTEHKSDFYFPTTYSQIADDTESGKKILIADGKVLLTVIDKNIGKKEVRCLVDEAGTILTGKGINLPYTKISLPALTEKDVQDAIFAAKSGIDFISLSFVRKPEDIDALRSLVLKHGRKDLQIIAKIEKPEAVDNIDEILKKADGIMIARGDLADEISFAKVPLVQKALIKKANKLGKLTIIATEMLSSMVDNQLPTRAEASDVANGVLDGADIIMLSNETAMGKYPVRAVKVMSEIAEEAEKNIAGMDYFKNMDTLPPISTLYEAICASAAELSHHLNCDAIAVFTRSGITAEILSKFRPEPTIFAATYDEGIYNKMSFYHNVYPIKLLEDPFEKPDFTKSIHCLQEKLLSQNLLKSGQKMIIVTGEYVKGNEWHINTIKLHIIE